MPVLGPAQNVQPVDDGAPCSPWTTDADIDPTCLTGHTPAIIAQAHRVATARLWALSGRRWGASCPVTVRPCLRSLCTPSRANVNVWPCDRYGTIVELDPPIYRVDSVSIDGQAFQAWTVDDHRFLRRTDGQAWPLRQDLGLAGSEVGTFEVVFSIGLVPPPGGVWAAAVLVCELLNARKPSARCRLPERTRTASAQGTTIELVDLSDPLGDGLTGLSEVDAWIVEVNPGRLSSRSTVMSPDHRPRRRR